MHPVEEVRGVLSDELKGYLLLLGASASSAVYKSIDVARALVKRGARVVPVLSPKACKWVSPTLFEWATGEKPVVGLSGATEHISLAMESSGMVVAPATLKTMAAIAHGYASNALTLCAITVKAAKKPVAIFPAMHRQLWESAQCRRVVDALRSEGYVIYPPLSRDGRLVLADPQHIARVFTSLVLRGRDLEGMRILVTAGATREYLDFVRFLSNPSSGRMGIEIATEALARGATVLLIAGHIEVEPPPWIPVVRVISVSDMMEAVERAIENFRPHAIIMAAAPCDYRPSKKFEGKIDSRENPSIELKLVANPKIVREIRKVYRGVLTIFAAEPVERVEDCEDRALSKMEEIGADVVVANPILNPMAGFAKETNIVFIATRKGFREILGPAPKSVVARRILDVVRDAVRSI